MRVYVLRHGIAQERTGDLAEFDRALTELGVSRTEKVAAALNGQRKGGKSVILTSPLVRARQTAKILQKALKGRQECIDRDWLAEPFDTATVFGAIEKRKEEAVYLVGHEPWMSAFVGVAIAGEAGASVQMKKAGVACLYFDGSPAPGGALLEWLVPPKIWIGML